MSDNSKTVKPVSDLEIGSIRQNLHLLRSQLQSGRVDGQFLVKQIEALSDLMARIEAERKQRQQEVRFKALYNVSRLLGSSLDLQTVLNQVMDAIIQLTGAERGFLMLRDDDGGLTVKAARNLDQQTLDSTEFKYSRTIVNQVLDSGKPVLSTNAAEDPRFSGQASIIGQALRSIMATPLRARGNVIGVVYVDNKAITGLFGQDDLDALDAFAGQAAVAIDNALLFSATDQELAARVDELTQLRRIDLQLNQTLDVHRAMLYTLEWACRLSGATSGHLGLVEGDPPRIHAVHHYGVDDDTAPEFLDAMYPEVLEVTAKGETKTMPSVGSQTVLIVPIRREQKVIGAVILKRDGNHAFTAAHQDLVERVVARAAVAIENARLYAAVQAADRAKSEFVGIVAHDLKVPMTSISGYADLALLQGGLTERQQEFMGRIKATVQRMAMLVSDLSDISRIESGHFFMNKTHVKIPDLIQAVKDNTLTEIQARKHTLIEQVTADLPEMWVDYYRLLQVLTNLVSNAYKYTPDGGTITLRVQPLGDRIEFSLADTGIGLSPESIKKLGTKFWRAEDDYTRSQPGTGLGFAITSSLVEQMGGKIVIESEVGKGSTFTFSLPVGEV
jgi:signal transduction histidine kinase/PAS domain-containing protein